MSKKAVVIGAGIGGLSAAIDLRSRGFEVDLYEKNGYTGGKAGFEEQDGFLFDTGPSLLTMPFVFGDLLKKAGKSIEEDMPVIKLDVICKYFFSDGTVLSTFNDREKMIGELEVKTSDKRGDIVKFLDYCESMYENAKDLFLFNSLEDVPGIFKNEPMRGLRIMGSLDIFRTLHASHKRSFRDTNNVQLFDRYATYSGSDPYRIAATFNIIPHVEYGIGAYVPEGGIRSIPRVLTETAAETGVRLFLNTKVDRIINDGKRVTGIECAGTETPYDIVVSNSDVSTTYRELLKDTTSKMASRYMKLEPSSSAIVFYWGIKETVPGLEVNNIFFSSDYRKEFDEIFRRGKCPGDPTVYVNITSKYCPKDAPSGCENWFVLVNVPYDKGHDWEKETDIVRCSVLSILEKYTGKNIAPLIISEKVMTPKDIYRNTLSNRGSIYGISSNSKLSGFYRQPNRSQEYKGLYFSGGSAHPGGGMPLVALSGMITSELIERHET